MKISPALAPLLLFLFAAFSLRAFQPPAQERLENFDRRINRAETRRNTGAERRAATSRLSGQVPDVRIDADASWTSPLWVRAERGFLTGKNGAGRSVASGALQKYAANDPARATKAFLDEHRGLFGYGAEALAGARVQREFRAPGTGLRTMIWEQHLDGIPVSEGLLTAHTTKDGELVSLSSRFHPDPQRGARAPAEPVISAAEAVTRAAKALKEEISAAAVKPLDAPNAGDPRRTQKFRAGPLTGETRTALVWLPLNDAELSLCWEVFLTRRTGGELYRVLIDAGTGEAWVRHCLTKYVTDPSFRVWTSDSPTPFSPGWSTPNTNQPPELTRALVTVSAFNTNVSPLGWIGEGLSETLGNNVDAHLDQDGDNAAELPRPQGPGRVFDFPANLALTPTMNADAAVVQLFYWCNWAHDRFYELGFTEAAGNFQADNLGRGGFEGDPVLADAQDGSGFNNANFSTPPDGSAPRMQMYLFISPTPHRDGDFDAEVILHEYAHGVTDRLVGGGGALLNVQSEGLAEGWSDFYALSLLSEPGDDVNGTYPLGAYVSQGLAGGQANYYFGIRHYPYCTDLSKNPITFRDIDPLQINSHTGVPRGPIGGGASEIHAQGEVWCSALWEARAQLVQRLGWTNGSQLMMQLVTDALPLTPANPNFLQARDAIIQADLIRTGGANYRDLWTAFAKRGLGAGATSPGSGTTIGVVEAFDVPDDLVITPSRGFTANGPVGGSFLPSTVSYGLTNLGTNVVVWSAIVTNTWLHIEPDAGALPPGTATGIVVSLAPDAAILPAAIYSGTVTLSNATSRFTQSRSFTLRVGQPDFFTELFEPNDNDLSFQQLTFVPDGSTNFYSICRQAVTNFPVDPLNGDNAGLGDDSFRPITLTGTNTVALYGRRTNTFFLGSNGYLTFDEGDSGNMRALLHHFSLPRVTGLLADLDPSTAGSLTWQELPDRVAFTWLDVTEWSEINVNNLQIEMFYDGVIRLTWLKVDARRGVAGLSAGGGVPTAFVESDLTAYGECPSTAVSIQVTNGCARLEWSAVPGLTYRAEFKSVLEAGSWTPLGTMTATNSVGAFVDCPAGEPQRFYRVVVP